MDTYDNDINLAQAFGSTAVRLKSTKELVMVLPETKDIFSLGEVIDLVTTPYDCEYQDVNGVITNMPDGIILTWQNAFGKRMSPIDAVNTVDDELTESQQMELFILVSNLLENDWIEVPSADYLGFSYKKDEDRFFSGHSGDIF